MPPTIGINLNNPGNIRHSDSQWAGASAQQPDSRFVAFDTPEDGIRALTKTLRTYNKKHGLRTVSGLIGRWAPPEENNTDGYIRHVSDRLGVAPGQPLDLDDERVLTKLAKAITRHENGSVPYTDDQIQEGVRAAFRDVPGDIVDAHTAPRRAPDSVGAERDLEFPTSDVFKQGLAWTWALDAEHHAPDPTFAPDEEFLSEHLASVPKDFWDDIISDAHSEKHFFYLRDRVARDLESSARIQQYGWSAHAATWLVALLDPVEAGVTAAVGGPVSAVAAKIAKGRRLSKIIGSAAAGGVGLGTATALTGAAKPTSEMEDVLYATAAGLALGAGYGAWKTKAFQEEARAVHKSAYNLLRRLDQDPGEDLAHMSRSAGAAEAPAVREALRSETGSYLFPSFEAPETAMGGVRFDAVGQLKSSQNPVSRALGALGEDGVGNADPDVALRYGATELKARLVRQADARWARTFETAYKEWSKDQGLNWWGRRMSRDVFSEEVSYYVRTQIRSQRRYHPAVQRVGDEFRSIISEFAQLARNPGKLSGEVYRPIADFDDLARHPRYVPRVFDARKIDEARARVGDKAIRTLIFKGIVKAQPRIDQEVAKKLAEGYWRVVRDSRWMGQGARVERAFAGHDIDFLRQILSYYMEPVEIESLARSLVARGEGGPKAARKRLLLDERVSITAWGETLHFTDLLNNNSDDLLRGYVQEMAGAVALARVRFKHPQDETKNLIDGITSEAEWKALLKDVASVAERIGQKDTELQRDLDNLEYLYSSITGVSHNLDARPVGQVLRFVGKMNFLRLMGQVGFAQISELGMVTTQMGLKATLRGFPMFRTLWRNAATGKIDDELCDELEGVFGIGADWLRGARVKNMDAMEDIRTLAGENAMFSKANILMDHGKRGLLAVSGMSSINTLLHRWSMRAIAHKFSIMADGGPSIDKARLRSLGLSEDLEQRALAELAKHRTVEKGMWRDQVRRINFDRWTDLEAREAFISAMDRLARRMVLENDPGTMHRWMSGPLSSLLLQFRVFLIGAYSKHLLHPIHMAKTSPEAAFTTFAGFMGCSFWAAMGYMLQTSVQSASRSDREEYLQKKLALPELAKAAFQRASYASLIPMAVDSGGAFLGVDPFFTARSTALPSNILLGNPTVDLLFDAPGRVLKGVRRGALTQRDMRAAAALAPLQNTLPIQSFLNVLIQDLPE